MSERRKDLGTLQAHWNEKRVSIDRVWKFEERKNGNEIMTV